MDFMLKDNAMEFKYPILLKSGTRHGLWKYKYLYTYF